MKRTRVAGITGVVSAMTAVAALAVFGPGPNSTTIPSTGQSLSVVISQPPDGSTIPMPPGTEDVEGSCSIGEVAGQPICLLYILDVSGSTDLNFMTSNGVPYVDANGNGMGSFGVPDLGDNFNTTAGDTEAGEVLDGEISGVLALHASIGNPSNVRVGLEAFATAASAADVGPALGFQFFVTPPQLDANALNGADINEVVRTFRSEFTTPAGGSIGVFTAVSQGTLGSGTRYPPALAVMNAALTNCQQPAKNIVFFLSDGESNAGFRCFQGACVAELAAAQAAGTIINTVGVGPAADGTDLQYIATQTGGTYTQVNDPSQLATILPTITPEGIDHLEVNGMVVALDALGNFTYPVTCATPGPITVTATCFADDPMSTNVSADITLHCELLCGNGMLESGEECDPPNGTTCDATCQRVPDCGDGFTDAPEACDPPDGSSCNASCQFISCGDGVTEGQEECDPPNGTTCDATCQRIPDCGDGFIDTPESCDPPNGSTCDTDCTLIECGNGEIEVGEECEPESPVPPCDPFTCQRIPVCGDGLLDAPEICDPPDGTTCDTDCTPIACGNNDVEPGEECDPPGATCSATCQRIPACGDTFVDAPEECEPPSSPNCDANCVLIACGNGQVQSGEECEPPSTPTCNDSCQRIPDCGDTFIDAPETCDPPDGSTCDADCTTIECGNGDLETGGGEECEPPNTPVCDPLCQRIPECGDGFTDTPEECEPPSSPNCDPSCLLIACGNGQVQPGEECDPPNTPTCDAICQRVPLCGDGNLDPPQEQCEPPNTESCSATCLLQEICTNDLDDDGDTLIDCLDPDCPPCTEPKKDPARITFDRSGKHRDKFKAHGRFVPTGVMNPGSDEVSIILTNSNGIIYRAILPAGQFLSNGQVFRFVDRAGVRADGLTIVRLKRVAAGNWGFSISAVGDLSAATTPDITFTLRVGENQFSSNRPWKQRGSGWFLAF